MYEPVLPPSILRAPSGLGRRYESGEGPRRDPSSPVRLISLPLTPGDWQVQAATRARAQKENFGCSSTVDTRSCILATRMLKALFWLGSSRSDIRNFPADAKRRVGYELFLVQSGLEPSDWKPMSSVGSGVQEIRVSTGREHRVFYIAKFEEAVYVLHAFEKKNRKTPKGDLELARLRLSELVRKRRAASRNQR